MPSPLLRLLVGKKAQETILADQRVVPARLKQAGLSFSFTEAEQASGDILS